jgi:Dolichyl-phosphate-mannose-protein mannosyltransferase
LTSFAVIDWYRAHRGDSRYGTWVGGDRLRRHGVDEDDRCPACGASFLRNGGPRVVALSADDGSVPQRAGDAVCHDLIVTTGYLRSRRRQARRSRGGRPCPARMTRYSPKGLLHRLRRMGLVMRRRSQTLAYLFVAITIAVLALVVRSNHISALPFDFHGARQYHSANIARAYYVESSDSLPDWKKRVARVNLDEDPPIELPVVESIAATAYRLSNGEHFWIPRLFSSLFWIMGALFVYLLATRFVRRWPAFLATTVYLFLPFPLVASTSFQPDPLMVMLILAALLAIVRHHEHPTRERLLAAGVVSAAAVLAKPGIAAFFLVPVFAALAIEREGTRAALTKISFYAFPALSLLPAAGLYVYSALTEQFVSGHVQSKVNPALWDESFYWRGWFDSVVAVLRPPFFGEQLSVLVLATAALGILLARTRTQRAILVALWSGYVAFGLVFTNHISSHDYYSLPLIPIVALSLGVVAGAVGGYLGVALRRRSVQAAAAALLVAAAVLGLVEKGGQLDLPRANPVYERRAAVYEQIGDLVHHTTRALVLERMPGLWHHGWVAGRYWPNQADLSWEHTRDDLRPISADERFVTTDDRYYPTVGAIQPRPTVFIVSEPMELVLQPDLCVLLSDFARLAQTPDYVIFDLTRSLARSRDGATNEETMRAKSMTKRTRFFYEFPPAWSGITPGMSEEDVLRVLGKPRRIETRRDLRKPFASWFYGPRDKFAVAFVDGRLFVKAQGSL